jgi:hypothetical protein
MLDRYLKSPPTVTERLAFAWTLKHDNTEKKAKADAQDADSTQKGKRSKCEREGQ